MRSILHLPNWWTWWFLWSFFKFLLPIVISVTALAYVLYDRRARLKVCHVKATGTSSTPQAVERFSKA